MMRLALVALIGLGATPAAVREAPAQELGTEGPSLGGHPKNLERCVDVSIGGESAYGCINQRLKNEVEKVAPALGNVAPLDARSQDIKLGIANVPAVRQQYGRNFGVSAVPYRPNLIYTSPLGR